MEQTNRTKDKSLQSTVNKAHRGRGEKRREEKRREEKRREEKRREEKRREEKRRETLMSKTSRTFQSSNLISFFVSQRKKIYQSFILENRLYFFFTFRKYYN
jgi:hypothetical protein